MEKQEYTLKRSRRKSLAIVIEAGGTVLVKAPSWLPKYRIELFLQEKSQWIAGKKAEVLRMEQAKPAHTYKAVIYSGWKARNISCGFVPGRMLYH